MIGIKISCLGPSDNHSYGMTRGGIKYLTSDAKDFKTAVAKVCEEVKKVDMYFNDQLDVDITYYFKRDRDVLGSDKILMDAMQGIVFKNDSQIIDAHIHKYRDKDNPRVEVIIKKANRKY